MTTPADLTYTDIETRVMNELRIPTSNATEQAKIQAVINLVYRDICAKKDWWWRIKKYPVVTGVKTLGTATLVRGSASVTLASMLDPYGNDLTNGDYTHAALRFDDGSVDSQALYRVTQTAVPPASTMESVYGGLSGSYTVNAYRDVLVLPGDVGKVLRVSRYGFPTDMRKIGIEEMEQRKQINRLEGAPQCWSIYDFDATGDPTQARLLIVDPFPDKNYRMDVWYQQNLNTELTGMAQPMIPDDFRQVLVYGALARCYPIFLNDLDRGTFYQSLFNDVMALMATQQREYASDHPGITPSNIYRRRSRRPRTAFVLGSWFDRLPIDW